jgi:UDP:flavonoid glycosyltransferase YjiC (YdhE family)
MGEFRQAPVRHDPGDTGLDVVGYWRLARPADWQPSAELVEFLAAGPPPVYLGFGSMTGGGARRLSALAVGGLRRAGFRAVVQVGWAGLAATGDDVITIGPVSHDWLLPRMAAVVHHAGASTVTQ